MAGLDWPTWSPVLVPVNVDKETANGTEESLEEGQSKAAMTADNT